MRKIIFFGFVSFLSVSLAQADWSRVKSTEFPLDPPPREGSAAYKKDFALLHNFEKSRTREDCALSMKQEHPTFEHLFALKEFDLLENREKALAKPLVEKVMKVAERVASYHKDKYKRPRPYDTDTTLEPCAKKPGGAKSYPSSHASSATAGACVLALIYPDRKYKIEQYGEYLGNLRVMVGVHHPSDVEAGQAIGKAVCEHLENDEEFQADLAGIGN